MKTAEVRDTLAQFFDRIADKDCPLAVAVQRIKDAPNPCAYCEAHEAERDLVRRGLAFAAIECRGTIAEACAELLAAQDQGTEGAICPFNRR